MYEVRSHALALIFVLTSQFSCEAFAQGDIAKRVVGRGGWLISSMIRVNRRAAQEACDPAPSATLRARRNGRARGHAVMAVED